MNKGELVDAIASKAEVTKKDADMLLGAMIDTIMETVASGDKVTLVGFGTFEQERPSRSRRQRFLRFRQASCLKSRSQSNRLNLRGRGRSKKP
jgi:nucleoid DNA-binding protein